MVWTDWHNEVLLQEMYLFEPWKYEWGSKQWGQVWERISESLNEHESPRFTVNQKYVRNHYILLEKEQKNKIREEKASGIAPEHTPFDDSMTNIIEQFRERDAEDQQLDSEKREKAEEETAKAVEMHCHLLKRKGWIRCQPEKGGASIKKGWVWCKKNPTIKSDDTARESHKSVIRQHQKPKKTGPAPTANASAEHHFANFTVRCIQAKGCLGHLWLLNCFKTECPLFPFFMSICTVLLVETAITLQKTEILGILW